MAADAEQGTRLVQPLKGGRITIPAAFRRKLGITEHTLLRLTLEGRSLRIEPVDAHGKAGDSSWFKELYDLFAPVREEAMQYSEEETNAAIDEAVAAVRRKHARRS